MPCLSIVINTCNEAHLLRDCIASVKSFADEIVVCDMESADDSVALARELGCQVITHPRCPAPEPEARIAAIEAAKGDWIFVVDPDMRIQEKAGQRIRELIQNDEADIVDFYCEHMYFGRLCRFGHGSQPVYRKLFKKSAFQPISRNIQTFWHDSLTGRALRLGREYAIRHLAYDTVEQCLEIHTRYAKREAEQAYEAGGKTSLWRMIFRPFRRFIGNYLLRQGFRDGVSGFIVASIVSWYVFLIEAYLWDLHRSKTTEA